MKKENKIRKTEEEWKKELGSEEYRVLREKGTEAPFTGKLLNNKTKGKYVCGACGNVIFESGTKFESECGWPSFYNAKEGAVNFHTDISHGMIRKEVTCARCGSHLGHVFADAPQTPTGQRYCINSLALKFEKEENGKDKTSKAVFGAGCFWHVEEAFRCVNGVSKTEVGYMGGDEGRYPNPSYEDVSSDETGFIEVCLVEYDSEKVSYEKLLETFWKIHNPTQLNRQGPDVGSQYKSVIFYYDSQQKEKAEKSKKQEQKKYSEKIATEIRKAGKFYKAEDYHQKYLMKRGLKSCNI